MKTRILKMAMALGAVVAAFFAVLFAPPIAIGFMTIAPTEMVDEKGLKVLVGFVAFAAAQFVLQNLAEFAILIAAVAMYKTIETWVQKIMARWEPTAELVSA
jgi:hypothetical protein